MPKLTPEQWIEQKPPFCFLHLNAPEHWHSVHFSMVEKWLNANVQGWWYGNLRPEDRKGDRRITYIFERNADRVLFKIWIADDPFGKKAGEIEIVNVVPGNESAEVDG